MNDRSSLYNDVRGGCVFVLEDKPTGKSFMYLTYIGARGRTYVQEVRKNKSDLRLGYIFPDFNLNKRYKDSSHPKISILRLFRDYLIGHIIVLNGLEWVVINVNPERDMYVDDDNINMSEMNDYLFRIGV